jgi:hypothetical protein
MDDIYKKKYLKYKIKYHELKNIKGGELIGQRFLQNKLSRMGSTFVRRDRTIAAAISGTGGDLWSQFFKVRYNQLYERMKDLRSITKLSDIYLSYGREEKLGFIKEGIEIELSEYEKSKMKKINIFINNYIDYINEITFFIDTCNTKMECMERKLEYNHVDVMVEEADKVKKQAEKDEKTARCAPYEDIKGHEYYNSSLLNAKRYLYNNTMEIFTELHKIMKGIFFVDTDPPNTTQNNQLKPDSVSILTNIKAVYNSLALLIQHNIEHTKYTSDNNLLHTTERKKDRTDKIKKTHIRYDDIQFILNLEMKELCEVPNDRPSSGAGQPAIG